LKRDTIRRRREPEVAPHAYPKGRSSKSRENCQEGRIIEKTGLFRIIDEFSLTYE
jgi:hypothetical protein